MAIKTLLYQLNPPDNINGKVIPRHDFMVVKLHYRKKHPTSKEPGHYFTDCRRNLITAGMVRKTVADGGSIESNEPAVVRTFFKLEAAFPIGTITREDRGDDEED